MAKISASIICGDPINLKSDLRALKTAKVDFIHFDIMDGIFVPRFGLYPEYLASIKRNSSIPLDVHLMVTNPEPYIPLLAELGADFISVHVENNLHLHRTLRLIKSFKIKSVLVLNLATPLNVLDYLLTDLDLITIMGINPGIIGHKLIPSTLKKVSDLKILLNLAKVNIPIEIDGGVTFDTTPSLLKAGADILVCGSSTIFNQNKSLSFMIKKFKKTYEI
jgi:ribulose-phosphate 3-epimerase